MTPNSESVEQLAERIVRHDVGGWYAGSDRARVTASIRDWLVSHNIDPATMKPMVSGENQEKENRQAMREGKSRPITEIIAKLQQPAPRDVDREIAEAVAAGEWGMEGDECEHDEYVAKVAEVIAQYLAAERTEAERLDKGWLESFRIGLGLNRKIEELEQQLAESRAEAEQLRNTVTQMQSHRRRAEKAIADGTELRQQLAESQAHAERMELERDNYRAHIKDVEDELERVRQKLAESQRRCAELEATSVPSFVPFVTRDYKTVWINPEHAKAVSVLVDYPGCGAARDIAIVTSGDSWAIHVRDEVKVVLEKLGMPATAVAEGGDGDV